MSDTTFLGHRFQGRILQSQFSREHGYFRENGHSMSLPYSPSLQYVKLFSKYSVVPWNNIQIIGVSDTTGKT